VRSIGPLPDELNVRARAVTWMFAALNTMKPPPWKFAIALIPEDAGWLNDEFSASDLMIVTVLRRSNRLGILEEHPNLCAYPAHGEAQQDFKRAFDAH